MRKRGRVDANQSLIVRDLRKLGFSVQSLADIGDGCPDLLIGKDGRNWLVEIKDSMLPPSHKKLSLDEKAFHDNWRGQVGVAETLDEVLRICK